MTEERLNYDAVFRAVAGTRLMAVGATSTEDLLAASTEAAFRRDLDAAIRADCELLYAWVRLQADRANWKAEHVRRMILAFVLERRQIVDWPSWADGWIAG